MIEIIQDGREREVLVYTDEAPTAVKLRKSVGATGAVYSGKHAGYSWRISKTVAIALLHKLGFSFKEKISVDK
jgi:hypothetical protein